MAEETVSFERSPRPQGLLEEGIALVRSGDRAGAREVFRGLIQKNPYDEDAWLWLAWAAESKKSALRCLEEAQRLLPESARVVEAIAWAKEQLATETPAKPKVAPRPAPKSEPFLNRLDDAARSAQRAASQTWEDIKDRVAIAAPLSRVPPALRGWAISALSVAALALLAFLIFLGASQFRRNVPVVRALELPPPTLIEATPTPSVAQRTSGLWMKVDVAWVRQDWETVIASLEQIRIVDSRNDEARKRLAEAYYQQGLAFIAKNDLEAAAGALNEAIRLDASSPNLQKTHADLQLYRQALDAYWAKDWAKAVSLLQQVYDTAPAFRDTRTLLGQAYCYLGVEMMQKDELESARNALRTSVELLPDWPEAQARLTEVENLITPPRRIEVDLSDKITTVYEDGKVIKTFRVCTGRPSAPTVAGRYKVKTKLDMAYASRWDLQMPYWLGIYDAGGSENGFHALPILSNGQTLWRSALGTGCSYGCIVLDTPDAKWLYDWAEIGTVVIVTK